MKDFILDAFSETQADGKIGVTSFSRLATAISLAFTLGWVTYLVVRTHAIPDLGGVTIFNSTLYALNRATAFFGNKDAKSS